MTTSCTCASKNFSTIPDNPQICAANSCLNGGTCTDNWADVVYVLISYTSIGSILSCLSAHSCLGFSAQYCSCYLPINVDVSLPINFGFSLFIHFDISLPINVDVSLLINFDFSLPIHFDVSLTINVDLSLSINFDFSLPNNVHVSLPIHVDVTLPINADVSLHNNFDISLLINFNNLCQWCIYYQHIVLSYVYISLRN